MGTPSDGSGPGSAAPNGPAQKPPKGSELLDELGVPAERRIEMTPKPVHGPPRGWSDPARGGPWISTACFAEHVERNPNGTLTLHRIIDRLTVALTVRDQSGAVVEAPGAVDRVLHELPQPMPCELTLVLSLKSGGFEGDLDIRIDLVPLGRDRVDRGSPMKVSLPRGIGGVNIVAQLSFSYTKPGVRWWNVWGGRRLLTRVPFEIVFQAGAAVSADVPNQT
jgi:hypothetical protein